MWECVENKNNYPKIIYITPEKINTSDCTYFLKLLNNKKKLSRFVIDEAHCVLTWSKFRKAYS